MPTRKMTIQEREIMRYRRRLTRTVGLYLAMFAWKAGLDGVVLMLYDVREFFGIYNTGSRMDQIKEDIARWFKYQRVYYLGKSPTQVHYLFLSSSNLEPYLPPGRSLSQSKMPKRSVVQKVLAAMDQNAPKLKLFSSLVEMPKQSDIIADLALFTAGVKAPKLKMVP